MKNKANKTRLAWGCTRITYSKELIEEIAKILKEVNFEIWAAFECLETNKRVKGWDTSSIIMIIEEVSPIAKSFHISNVAMGFFLSKRQPKTPKNPKHVDEIRN
jgi:hypothetical protein